PVRRERGQRPMTSRQYPRRRRLRRSVRPSRRPAFRLLISLLRASPPPARPACQRSRVTSTDGEPRCHVVLLVRLLHHIVRIDRDGGTAVGGARFPDDSRQGDLLTRLERTHVHRNNETSTGDFGNSGWRRRGAHVADGEVETLGCASRTVLD